LLDSELSATEIAIKAMKIAASIDIYTNGNYTLEVVEAEIPTPPPSPLSK
jgi:ATP-dependent protease HslVU (ClpYQ) peptidase subunit